MATEVRMRRGTAAQHAAFTGASSEFTHDTTKQAIRVHDGITPGGNRTLMESELGQPGGVAKLGPDGGIDPSLSTFVQAGTGAISRTSQSKIRGSIVSPNDFRQPGDSDDTASFLRARDYIMSLPKGGYISGEVGNIYDISASINIPLVYDVPVGFIGNGAVIRAATGFNDELIIAGDNVGGVGVPPFECIGWRFEGKKGVRVDHWGNALIERNNFVAMSEGIIMNESYSNTLRRNRFLSFQSGGIAVHALTSCMHLVAENNAMYDVTNAFKFEALTYSIKLLNNDMEGGQTAISVPMGGGSFLIQGSHIEGQTGTAIYFGAATQAVEVRGGYIGYNSGTLAWTNITSGILDGVTFADQQQSVAASASGLTVGVNHYYGTSNRIFSQWTAPTFTNGFSNTGGTWENAGYQRDFANVVRLRGMVQASADAVAFSLPVGHRPTNHKIFPIMGSTGTAVGKVEVWPTGEVTVYRTSNGTADLSPVEFVAGQ